MPLAIGNRSPAGQRPLKQMPMTLPPFTQPSPQKRLAVLGSTGSIGTQTLDVARQHPDKFSIEVLTAWNQAEKLIEQALEFKPNMVVIGNEELYREVDQALWNSGIKVFAGPGSIADAACCETVDTVVAAIMGSAGLKPTLKAIEAGKEIALANKETLVSAGALVCKAAMEKRVRINPVDSEHSAIFQCLAGEAGNPIEKIFLTGSGGPFRGKKRAELSSVKPEEALRHPTWNMGRKISIDSATLMNKGLEMIEAHWLFGVPAGDIEVVIHPESIVHSLVYFADGAALAQLGYPDMRVPIQLALTYPERLPCETPLDLPALGKLTFLPFPEEKFPCFPLAIAAGKAGGIMPTVLNAAAEEAVRAFLNGRITFPAIAETIQDALGAVPQASAESFLQLSEADGAARRRPGRARIRQRDALFAGNGAERGRRAEASGNGAGGAGTAPFRPAARLCRAQAQRRSHENRPLYPFVFPSGGGCGGGGAPDRGGAGAEPFCPHGF